MGDESKERRKGTNADDVGTRHGKTAKGTDTATRFVAQVWESFFYTILLLLF